jgi:hypothetical protein
MTKLKLLLILTLGYQICCGQQKISIIKAGSNKVDITDGDLLRKGYWYIMPEKRPDKYFVEIPRKPHKVTFHTDIDSISFNVQYGGKYDFIILLNNKDSCFTQIVSLPKQLFPFKKECNNCNGRPDTIPFIIGNNDKIFIKGKTNNSEELTFQFDLGASENRIKTSSIKRANVKADQTNNENETKSSLNQLSLSKLVWDSVPFFISDQLSSREDGIVGNTLFQDKVVEINYDKKLIIIYETLPNTNGYSKHEILIDHSIPFIEGILTNGTDTCKSWFVFDTGDSGNGMVTDEVAIKNNMYDKVDKKFVFGSRNIVVFPQLLIGPYKFSNLSGIIESKGANTNDLSILGNALLKRFNVILDNQNGIIYLKPNSLYNTPFEHPEVLIQRIIIGTSLFFIVIILFIVYRRINNKRKTNNR